MEFNVSQKTFLVEINKFEPIRLEEKANVSVDFVAHGISNEDTKLYIIPLHLYNKGVRDNYTDVRPPSIAEFLLRNATEGGQLKFETFNLISCESKKFGLELSRLLENVNVVCYDKDIYIKKVDPNSGLPHYINAANQGVPAPQIIYRNGIDITPVPIAIAPVVDKNPPAEMLLRHQARVEVARLRSTIANDSAPITTQTFQSTSLNQATNTLEIDLIPELSQT